MSNRLLNMKRPSKPKQQKLTEERNATAHKGYLVSIRSILTLKNNVTKQDVLQLHVASNSSNYYENRRQLLTTSLKTILRMKTILRIMTLAMNDCIILFI